MTHTPWQTCFWHTCPAPLTPHPLRARTAHNSRSPPMAVQVELKRIIITEASDQQVIYLKEVTGERAFPIVIGSTEAIAIDRRLKGQPTPRPQTHELLSSVIEK